MKKKVVAVVLSLTLCMATVLQTGAAAFSDQQDTAAVTIFDDSASDTSAGNSNESVPEEPVDFPEDVQEVTPVAEVPEKVTPTPDVEDEVTPTPEEVTPAPEEPDDIFLPPEESVDPDTSQEGQEEVPDVDIFSAGESIDVPEKVVPVDEEADLLAAAEGKIFAANWKQDPKSGKWKLLKPAKTTMNASSGESEEAGSGEAAFQAAQSEDIFAAETVPQENETQDTADAAVPDTEDTALAEPVPPEEAIPTEGNLLEAGDTTSVEENDLSAEDTLSAAAEEYYTAADGIVHIETYSSVSAPNTLLNSGYYYFDKDGYMVTGQYVIPKGTVGSKYSGKKEHFFTDEANAKLLNSKSTAACNPVNSDLGQMKTKYWLWTGKVFRYYADNGGFRSVNDLKKIKTENKTYTGYYTINGSRYILASDGSPRVGHITIKDGNKPGQYYGQAAEKPGDIPGKLVRSSWIRIKDSKGNIQWRKYLSDGRYWDKGIVATKLDSSLDQSVGDYTYLLSPAGYILKNTMKKAANGYYYCTDKNGRIYKGKLVKYNNSRYYIGASGRRATWTNSWHKIASKGNRYYYFGTTPGKVVEKTGWQRIIKPDGKSAGWFYFPKNGDHYINKLTSTGRYFRTDGRLASGITTVNGKTYFFQGSTTTAPKGKMYKNTWIHYNNKWYYAGSDGVLYKNGWKYIKGYYYYFNKDYTVKTNATVTRNGIRGYVDNTGKFLEAGWIIVNDAKNQVKYVDPSTGLAVNCSKVIDGLRYYFDKDGYRINDLTGLYNGPYYLVADRVNGVMTVYDSSRTVPLKTIRISVGLPSTPTWPTNKDMKLSSWNRWQELMGPSWGQYGTHVEEAGNGGIFVHSVAGSTRSYYNLPAAAYNMLGQPASHGCIRCCVADARWVFYNCNGSDIRIIDGTYKANESFKGPLGRKALVPLYGSCNFDPTDNLAWH